MPCKLHFRENQARRPFGRSGLTMPTLGFGASGIAKTAREDATPIVHAALAAGLDHVDTAPFYGLGESERRLAPALAATGHPFTLSTKVGRLIRIGSDGAQQSVFDYSESGAETSLAESLARMGRERVDMAILHDVSQRFHGERTDMVFDEAMQGAYQALARWRREGRVRAIGIGVNDCRTCLRALREGDFDFLLLAGRLTLLDHEGFDEVLPEAHKRGVGVIAAAPFNSGILAIGARPDATFFYQPASAEILERTRRIEAVCARHGVPLPAAALQFPLLHPVVGCVLAGYRSVEEVRQNVAHARHAIPAVFWEDLRAAGLLSTSVAMPGAQASVMVRPAIL